MNTPNQYSPVPGRYDSMTYNRCGRSGLKLPAVSLGLWHNFGGSALIGASSPAQIDDAVGALENTDLSTEELAAIDEILAV